MSLHAPAPVAGLAVAASTLSGGAGHGSDSAGVGRATENAQGRKTAPITRTCLACGREKQGHNDEHRGQWLREAQ